MNYSTLGCAMALLVDLALMAYMLYMAAYERGWQKGREHLQKTLSEGLDSLIEKKKILVFVRKDETGEEPDPEKAKASENSTDGDGE